MGINHLVTMIFARPNIINIIITSFIVFETKHKFKNFVKQIIKLSKMFYIKHFIPIFQFIDFQILLKILSNKHFKHFDLDFILKNIPLCFQSAIVILVNFW
jgi:hypothetical protein